MFKNIKDLKGKFKGGDSKPDLEDKDTGKKWLAKKNESFVDLAKRALENRDPEAARKNENAKINPQSKKVKSDGIDSDPTNPGDDPI